MSIWWLVVGGCGFEVALTQLEDDSKEAIIIIIMIVMIVIIGTSGGGRSGVVVAEWREFADVSNWSGGGAALTRVEGRGEEGERTQEEKGSRSLQKKNQEGRMNHKITTHAKRTQP